MDDTLQQAARTALACLDLTSLNDADTPAEVDALCTRALGPFGTPAAVCVWPRFVAQARGRLPATVKVAAVANFPDGSSDTARAVADTRAIVEAGGDEVDVVIPYRDLAAAPALLAAVRRACEGRTLKVILETGELPDATAITRACRIALEAGADFLKTSTGKTRVSATPAAVALLLQAVRGTRCGVKASGGIRSVADAAGYLAQARAALGDPRPANFRFGASGLLNDIEAVLGGRAAPAAPSSY